MSARAASALDGVFARDLLVDFGGVTVFLAGLLLAFDGDFALAGDFVCLAGVLETFAGVFETFAGVFETLAGDFETFAGVFETFDGLFETFAGDFDSFTGDLACLAGDFDFLAGDFVCFAGEGETLALVGDSNLDFLGDLSRFLDLPCLSSSFMSTSGCGWI